MAWARARMTMRGQRSNRKIVRSATGPMRALTATVSPKDKTSAHRSQREVARDSGQEVVKKVEQEQLDDQHN